MYIHAVSKQNLKNTINIFLNKARKSITIIYFNTYVNQIKCFENILFFV